MLDVLISVTFVKEKNIFLCFLSDISERKQAEALLLKSEARHKAMISNISDVIGIIDQNMILKYQSPNIERCFGWLPDDLAGTEIWKTVHPDDLERVQTAFYKILLVDNAAVTVEYRNECKDGSYKMIHLSAINLVHDECIKGVLLNFHDITERIQMAEELNETQAILLAALDNSQAGIAIVKSSDRKLSYVNKAGLLIVDDSEEEWVGNVGIDKYIESWNILHFDGTPYAAEDLPLSRAMLHGETISEEYVIRREHFEDRIVWANAAPIYDEDGMIKAGIIIFLNITDKKRLESELVDAKNRSEQANIAKSQFLANMSHEIRTPLNGVVGMLQLLKRTEITEEQADFVDLSLISSDMLLRVINDILDYSKIDAGKVDLEKTVFQIRTVINDVVRLLKPSAIGKGLNMKVSIAENIPDHIIGDPHRVGQILINLLGNAVKFTDYGIVEIAVKRNNGNYENEIKLEFTVRDTGIGIPQDQIEVIFKSFSQVDNSNTRQYGGTGLGLAISKSLAELMGGEIRVESVQGEGSIFYFTCVFGTPALKHIHSGQSMELFDEYQEKGKPRILLVEDDAISRMVLEVFSRKKGWETTAVENGEKAVHAFQQMSFDLVLMDLQMPVMNGYKATEAIRCLESRKGLHTPIIAMTAFALKGDKEKCIQAGMDDFIPKPIDMNELSSIIEKWTRRS